MAVYVLLARLRLWRHLVILIFRSYFWHLIDLQDLKPCSFILALLSDDVFFTVVQLIVISSEYEGAYLTSVLQG